MMTKEHNISDFQRARFSSLQRMMYFMSALILWAGCIVLIALPPSSTSVTVDTITIVCLTIYALLSIAEGRIVNIIA
jgi:hypothetical protein